MFDLSKKKKDQYSAPTQLSPIYAPTIRAAGPRISSLPALRSQTPPKFDYTSKLTTSHTPSIPQSQQPNALQKIAKSVSSNSIAGKLGYKLGSAIGNGDFRTPAPYLPNYTPTTFGDKAIDFASSNIADLPLWLGGEALVTKPLAALAKTKYVAKGIGAIPKFATPALPALGTGVKLATAFGGPINALETAVSGDGLQGFTNRLKQAPLMGVGGVALHGAGSLLGKGIKTGSDKIRFNNAIKLPEINSNPLQDFQTAYKNPTTLRDIRQQSYNKTFADVPLNTVPTERLPIPKQGMSPTEILKQKELDAQSAFGKPREINKYNFTTSEQRASRELQDGIETAQNFVKHTDVLAGYPAGTTVEQAYADVLKNTGVDLPKLMSNWEKASSTSSKLTPQQLNMGRKAGVIPTLKPRDPVVLPDFVQPTRPGIPRLMSEKPSPLQWTNKDLVPSAEPLQARPQAPQAPSMPSEVTPVTSIAEPRLHPTAEKIISKLDDYEAQARARIASNRGRLNAGIPIDNLADYSIIGAVKIAKGSVNFATWSADMVKDFGDEVQPHLKQIWEKSKQNHADIATGKLEDTHQARVGSARRKVGQEATQYVKDQNLLENSDKWVDKKPLSLQTETMDRNIIDMAGPKDGAKIKQAIFDPIHTNEADFNRAKNDVRGQVKALDLSNKEREIVQQVGEGKLDIGDIPAGISADKIRTSVDAFRGIYNNWHDLVNEALSRNGYKPIGKLDNYFPHFEGDDPLMKALGIKINLVDLPTDINGLSHQFRPGKNWAGNLLHRTGDKTTFDAVQGFDRYIESVGKVIFHTDDIQRLRAFEREIRLKYSPDEVQNQVKALIDNKTISKDVKDLAIEDLLGRDTTQLSNTVNEIQQYTNVLAGKKDLVDRAEEQRFGRQIYNIAAVIENRIGKNMVAVNPGTWITQFIPLTQSLATTNKFAVAQAMRETMQNIFKNDGFVNRSTFLTNRVGSDVLSKGFTEKVGDKLSAPMRWVDQFSSQVVTRSKYLEGLKQGLNPNQAIAKADDWAAKLLGDRSAGAQARIFNQLNPVTRLFTQFQLESRNQISFLMKDLPREYLKDGKSAKSVAKLTSAVSQLMVFSWMYNQVFEKLTGRRPALDPIGIAANLGKDLNNPNLTKGKAITNLGNNVGQQIPFVGGVLFNGGRIPVTAALKPLASLPTDIIGMGTSEDGPAGGAMSALGHLGTAAEYIVPPFGGGQIKKSIEAYGQLKEGGVYQGDKLKYPVESTPSNIIKGAVFGPSSFKEALDYYDNGRTPLTAKQTEALSTEGNIGRAYLEKQNQRKIDALEAKRKKALKK